MLTGVLAAPLSSSLHAGIIFNAGDWTVGQNGNVSVPIKVSSDLGSSGSVYWGSTQFDLVWTTSVLSLQQTTPVDFTGSPLAPYSPSWSSGPDGESTILSFHWYSTLPGAKGVLVPDDSTLFTVNFAAGDNLGTTLLSFENIEQVPLVDQDGKNLIYANPIGDDGQVTVVPEPINWALGLFAFVFIGSAAIRLIRNRFLRLAV